MATERDSQYVFQYLNDVWDLLPDSDKIRFGELWRGYEQTYGGAWNQLFGLKLSASINFLPLYTDQRWLQFTFDSTTQVLLAASYQSPQDLSQGINLSSRYLINMSVNGGSPVEIDLRGQNASATLISEIVAAINAALPSKPLVAASTDSNQLLQFTSPIKGPTSQLAFFPASNPALDASEIILGLDPSTDLPLVLPKYPYTYQLPDPTIIQIPTLQTRVHMDPPTVILNSVTDYSITFGSGVIGFLVAPAQPLYWAPDTYFNQQTPYNNFGYLMGIYDSNTPSYLKAVKGLWFAFWTGPTPENIKRSLYLLFGLPTASQAGTVTTVTSNQISLLYNDNTTETFAIPLGLGTIVNQGQVVTLFQPLVTGINVFDKINYPGFMTKQGGILATEPFLTQFATRGSGPDTDQTKALRLLEENTYLPQIDVNAFISPTISLGNVKTFLSNIQPKSRTYLFQVLIGTFLDNPNYLDDGNRTAYNDAFPNGEPALQLAMSFDLTPNVDNNQNTDGQQSDRVDAETNEYTYTRLDSDVFTHGDYVTLEVYHGATLVETIEMT